MISRGRIQQFISIAVLVFLLIFTYLDLFGQPYRGFNLNTSNYEILTVFHSSSDRELRPGDKIVRVGDTTIEEFQTDPYAVLFDEQKPGSDVEIEFDRDGERITLIWTMPGQNLAEFGDRLLNVWWLAYIFWLAGMATCLLIRPIDRRQELLIAFFYITAIWLMTGSIGWSKIGYSNLIFRSVLWFTFPIYIQLHWEFPDPIKQTRWIIWIPLYLAAGVMAVMQWLQALPSNTPLFILGLAIIGSILLYFYRLIFNKVGRREIAILSILVTIFFLPILVAITIYLTLTPSILIVLTLFSLAGLPVAYFYVAYRGQPGWLEFRANRLITFYVFLIILFITIILIALVLAQGDLTGLTLPQVFLILIVIAILSIFGFPRFQRWFERVLLGLPLNRQKIVEIYASQITSNLNSTDLNRLLVEKLMPSLQIQQSAIVQMHNNDFDVLYLDNLSKDDIPTESWKQTTQNYPSGHHPNLDNHSWLKAVIPLTLKDQLQGIWLLGRKDPDDNYSREDLHLLQILGDQTAIALSNIQKTEVLRALYAINIERDEAERSMLARELHDHVLNDLAALGFLHGDFDQFKSIHSRLSEHIRQMVRGLRPADLQYGLWRALVDFFSDVEGRLPEQTTIHFDLPKADSRYPADVEQHIFRICQQAIENALAHAQAAAIQVKGFLMDDEIELIVEDDGIGMGEAADLNLPHLLENKHYGVVGMVERAQLIGASLDFDSQSGQFTRVVLNWTDPAGTSDSP